MNGDLNKLKGLLMSVNHLECPDCCNSATKINDSVNDNNFYLFFNCDSCGYKLEVEGTVKKYMNLVNDVWVDLPNNMTDLQYIEKYFSDANCLKDQNYFCYDVNLDEFLYLTKYEHQGTILSFAALITGIKYKEKIP